MTYSEIMKKIDVELGKFNFSKNSLGYEYLVDAIFLVIKDKKCAKNFNELVYPKIAEKYDTKSENVMWCISKLLNLMYINTDEKVSQNYFNIYEDESKLSPKSFIMCVSRHIVNDDSLLEIIY